MNNIPLRHFDDYEAMSRAAADHILKRLSEKSKIKLGLATGYSPKLTYHYIGRQLQKNPNWVKQISIIQLDEWLGVLPAESASCNYYLKNNVVDPWSLNKNQCHLLSGNPGEASSELIKLKKVQSQESLDLCILGLGHNGHLALNEPGSQKSDISRIVDLQTGSRKHTMLSSHHEPVTQGLTIGLSEIMDSREIVLLVTGQDKKSVFENFLTLPPVNECPASALFDHKNWMCFVDESAIS